MTTLEKQIDLLVRYTVADDEELKKQLREELTVTLQEIPEESLDNSTRKLDDVIENLLDELGVPHNLLGRNYIARAIALIISDQENLTQITGVLYPTIAYEFDTFTPRVERAIRHAIEVAWDRCGYDVCNRLFGNTIDPNKGKPTNSQFLACCAKIVRRRMQDTVN